MRSNIFGAKIASRETGELNSKIKELWQRWVKVSKKIGDFQARLLLSLFYIIFVLPLGLLLRLFADPLGVKKNSAHWTSRQSSAPRLQDARRQF
jgi:hypothetical protein